MYHATQVKTQERERSNEELSEKRAELESLNQKVTSFEARDEAMETEALAPTASDLAPTASDCSNTKDKGLGSHLQNIKFLNNATTTPFEPHLALASYQSTTINYGHQHYLDVRGGSRMEATLHSKSDGP